MLQRWGEAIKICWQISVVDTLRLFLTKSFTPIRFLNLAIVMLTAGPETPRYFAARAKLLRSTTVTKTIKWKTVFRCI